jgi:hypothetical protein
MPRRFAQGRFSLKNPDKYMGTKDPLYRSSWEFAFMKFCDESAAIAKWASEAVRIPYRNPLTGRYTIYVPDFFINYVDKGGQQHAEIVEIKPQNQSLKEKVGKNLNNQASYILNRAKWEAATVWCRQKGLRFRVINETDIFHQGNKRR